MVTNDIMAERRAPRPSMIGLVTYLLPTTRINDPRIKSSLALVNGQSGAIRTANDFAVDGSHRLLV